MRSPFYAALKIIVICISFHKINVKLSNTVEHNDLCVSDDILLFRQLIRKKVIRNESLYIYMQHQYKNWRILKKICILIDLKFLYTLFVPKNIECFACTCTYVSTWKHKRSICMHVSCMSCVIESLLMLKENTKNHPKNKHKSKR